MKTFHKFSSVPTALLLLMLSGTSCLKDDLYDDQEIGTQINKNDKIVEIRGPITGSYGQVLDFKTTDTTIGAVTVNLASNEPATEDVKVVLALDNAVITQFNEDNGETFEPLPTTNYEISTFEVTIPRGQREGVLNAKILNPTLLEGHKYALGVKIVSASAPGVKVSGNFGQQVVALRVKNKYHGDYKGVGVFHHPVLGDRTFDLDKVLVTVEPNSVQTDVGDVGPGFQMIIIVNADNSITIEPAGDTPNIQMYGGSAENYYDPVTKAFHMHYGYTTSAPRTIEEVITLVQ